MLLSDFFGEHGGRSSQHSDLEKSTITGSRLCEDTGDQNGKPPPLPYPFPYAQGIIITSVHFFQPLSRHHLQRTFN